jgi:cell division protein ZipA
MGLNLETLIGILIILILLIVADGVRRMVREHRSRLRIKVDPRFSDAPETDEDNNPELPGGSARVVRPASGESHGEEEDEQAPPLVMEAEEQPRPDSLPDAEQQALFPESREPEPEPESPADTGEILEVIVVHVMAPRPHKFDGQALLRQLLEQGMRFGEMSIFHRHESQNGREELQFSMANALEPGIFDIDTMEEEQFSALSFFLKLPGPSRPREALDRMLASARKIAQSLDGELRDEQHSVLTPQTVEHLHERVQEFERRQRVRHDQ